MNYKRRGMAALFALCAMVVMSADAHAGSCGATPKNSQSVSSCPFTAGQGDILLDFTGDRSGNTSNDYALRDPDTHLWSYNGSLCGVGKKKESTSSVNVAPGEYKVSMYTYDAYEGRNTTTPQPDEKASIVFGQNGKWAGETQTSPDLPDLKTKAEWTGSLGTVNLPNGATHAILKHNAAVTSHPNSLSIGCVLIESVSQCGNGTVENGEQCDDGNTNGGDGCSATCQNEPENAVCGSAHGESFETAPTAGLCASGTPTAVQKDNGWFWTCNGRSGGASVDCSATLSAPACGAANGKKNLQSAPVDADLCDPGNAIQFAGAGTASDPYTWKCRIPGGATSDICTAQLQGPRVGPACNAGNLNAKPSASEACTRGVVTDPPGITGTGEGTNPWTWTCSHNGQTSRACSATKHVPQGEVSCGADHGEILIGRQPTNLCAFGTASSVSQVEKDWQWTCSDGTRSVQCHAQAKCNDGEIECNGVCQKMTIQGAVQTGFDAQGNPIPVHLSLDLGSCRPPAGKITCDVNGESYTIEELIDDGIDYEVTHNDAGDVVEITCDGETVKHKIACVCTARKCSAGGACVATPVFTSSSTSGRCSSECTTNADCGGGSIGEVKP